MLATEAESLYNDLEKMSVQEILTAINQEDRKVPDAMKAAIPALEKLISAASEKVLNGGRLFYMGAGTSGRIGVLDASECPPTFGVDPDLVTAIMAGGDSAIRSAAEGAEDHPTQGWQDLQDRKVSNKDFVIGIAASGRTPYVVEALKTCRANNIATGCVVCNANSPIAVQSDFPVELIVGPEFVTGSTRMKAGTAQKLALNMISTAIMIRLGKVEGNRMVNMALTNEKLVARGTDMVVAQTNLAYDDAQKLLLQHGSVKKAVDAFKSGNV
ncbi:MAG TPA: N-acetylmuramic acid 6-phosphate etherase [Alphaproteobacteria bacterium]